MNHRKIIFMINIVFIVLIIFKGCSYGEKNNIIKEANTEYRSKVECKDAKDKNNESKICINDAKKILLENDGDFINESFQNEASCENIIYICDVTWENIISEAKNKDDLPKIEGDFYLFNISNPYKDEYNAKCGYIVKKDNGDLYRVATIQERKIIKIKNNKCIKEIKVVY